MEDFKNYTLWFQPWQQTKISKNYFYDNHANIVMFDTQTESQASSLFVVGGVNTTIDEN